MENTLKIALIIILLLYILFILNAVKKKNMRIGYLIFWSITGIFLIIALMVPNLIENMSKFIGFEVPINMIFSIAIFIILYLLFNITILISHEKDESTMLIQEISILKKRISELENNREKNNGK